MQDLQQAVTANVTNLPIGSHAEAPVHPTSSIYELQPEFSPAQAAPSSQQLKDIIVEKQNSKEYYYGIEVMAHSFSQSNAYLFYSNFGSILPVFTSIVWLGMDYSQIDRLENIDAIQLAQTLQQQTVVLPHFTCYRLNSTRLQDFLNLKFSNVLIVRGDLVDEGQEFGKTVDLVKEIRKIREDSISIGIAGHPNGLINAESIADDMEFLLAKQTAGADFIITQLCFSSQSFIDFVKTCRSRGVHLPIIFGVYVPSNLRLLQHMLKRTRVPIEATLLEEYKELRRDSVKFQQFAVDKAVQMISEVFEADIGVYGVQFYTMNRFEVQPAVISALKEKGYFKINEN